MKQFYGVYKKDGKYILDLVSYEPGAAGETNPQTGRPTSFKTLEVVETFTSEKAAAAECERLNIELV